MESKIKHLEFIQAIISRMAQNSFLIKGWCITLVSAIYALAAKDANHSFVLISYFSIPCFWIMDGFFIATERRYRKLYETVASRSPDDVDFSLDATKYETDTSTWQAGIFSKTLCVFYLPMVLISVVVTFVLPKLIP